VDGAEDIESLLRILYHECALPFKRLDPETPSAVKRVLALANKYGMDHLRHRIVMHVEADWPQSLWQWDRLEAEIHSMVQTWPEEHGLYIPNVDNIDDILPEPASAIRLGRECDIPSILPAAFYHLSRLSIHDDRTSQRAARGHEAADFFCFDGRRTADWTILSSADYICLLKGRAMIATFSQELFTVPQLGNYQHSIDGCVHSEQATLLVQIREACRRSPDVLETSRRYLERESFGDQVCSICVIYIRKELRNFRHSLWAKLPQFFGLTS